MKAVSNESNIDMTNEDKNVEDTLNELKSKIDEITKLYTDGELTIEPDEAYKLAKEVISNPARLAEIKAQVEQKALEKITEIIKQKWKDAGVFCSEHNLSESLKVFGTHKTKESIDEFITQVRNYFIQQIDDYLNSYLEPYGLTTKDIKRIDDVYNYLVSIPPGMGKNQRGKILEDMKDATVSLLERVDETFKKSDLPLEILKDYYIQAINIEEDDDYIDEFFEKIAKVSTKNIKEEQPSYNRRPRAKDKQQKEKMNNFENQAKIKADEKDFEISKENRNKYLYAYRNKGEAEAYKLLDNDIEDNYLDIIDEIYKANGMDNYITNDALNYKYELFLRLYGVPYGKFVLERRLKILKEQGRDEITNLLKANEDTLIPQQTIKEKIEKRISEKNKDVSIDDKEFYSKVCALYIFEGEKKAYEYIDSQADAPPKPQEEQEEDVVFGHAENEEDTTLPGANVETIEIPNLQKYMQKKRISFGDNIIDKLNNTKERIASENRAKEEYWVRFDEEEFRNLMKQINEFYGVQMNDARLTRLEREIREKYNNQVDGLLHYAKTLDPNNQQLDEEELEQHAAQPKKYLNSDDYEYEEEANEKTKEVGLPNRIMIDCLEKTMNEFNIPKISIDSTDSTSVQIYSIMKWIEENYTKKNKEVNVYFEEETYVKRLINNLIREYNVKLNYDNINSIVQKIYEGDNHIAKLNEYRLKWEKQKDEQNSSPPSNFPSKEELIRKVKTILTKYKFGYNDAHAERIADLII